MLEQQLASRAKRKQYGFVAVGSATDAYIWHEEQYRLTRGMLQLLLKYRFPVFISTKCTLVKRDIDLLKQIDAAAMRPADLKATLCEKVAVPKQVFQGYTFPLFSSHHFFSIL
ncbi:MAG: hypothetical protein FJY20_11750 [Bacteroidetes bacterium]|nr:hypothetical protein [Bacteroidota bacterium]